MDVNRKYWLWFTRIDGFGRKRQELLLKTGLSPKSLFYAKEDQLKQSFSNPLFKQKDVRAFLKSREISHLLSYEKRLSSMNVNYVTIEDDAYPEKLKAIYDPPYVLYYIGKLPDCKLSIGGVVGSRKATAYGRKVAEKFGQNLGKHGVNVVSGMATGIDTYSHQGALESGGFTTAVLGCGINVCYPRHNKELMKKNSPKRVV